MRKFFYSTIIIATVFIFYSGTAYAQMMGGFSNSGADWDEVAEHTLREEKEGQEIWGRFQNREIACADINDEQFGVLGEYFMGTMAGDYHTAMNVMMIQRLGEEGEEQMHITMGKRMSGCDTSSQYPQGFNFMPMMGGWSSPSGFNNNTNNSMMWGFNNPMGFGWFGGIFMLLFWILIIAGIVVLIKWLVSQSHGTQGQGKTSIDILKERYAKGEINKEEFDKMRKDLQ